MEKSPTIGKLAAALSTFQGTVEKVKKDANNPFFGKKYASLSNILDAIQEPLANSGLSVAQFPDGEMCLTTILMHAESGEYLQATYAIHPVKTDPQGIGSAITYARRYALGAILSINVDDDDDGNAASQPAKNGKQQKPAADKDGVTDEDVRLWQEQVNQCNTVESLGQLYNKNEKTASLPRIKALFTARRSILSANQTQAA